MTNVLNSLDRLKRLTLTNLVICLLLLSCLADSTLAQPGSKQLGISIKPSPTTHADSRHQTGAMPFMNSERAEDYLAAYRAVILDEPVDQQSKVNQRATAVQEPATKPQEPTEPTTAPTVKPTTEPTTEPTPTVEPTTEPTPPPSCPKVYVCGAEWCGPCRELKGKLQDPNRPECAKKNVIFLDIDNADDEQKCRELGWTGSVPFIASKSDNGTVTPCSANSTADRLRCISDTVACGCAGFCTCEVVNKQYTGKNLCQTLAEFTEDVAPYIPTDKDISDMRYRGLCDTVADCDKQKLDPACPQSGNPGQTCQTPKDTNAIVTKVCELVT